MKKIKFYLMCGIGVIGIALASASISHAAGFQPAVSPDLGAKIEMGGGITGEIQSFHPVATPNINPKVDTAVSSETREEPVAQNPVVSPRT